MNLIKIVVKNIITGIFYIFRVFPIQNNKIVIVNYAGKGFGDNGKYIALKLLEQDKKYDIVWLITNPHDTFPEGIRRVPYYSLKSIYEQVTAKIWIDNSRKPSYVRKRKNQYYIMTWHGGIGPKKIEKEALNQLPKHYIEQAKNDARMTDLMVAESEFSYKKYKNMFWYEGKIAKCGVPRQDILFKSPKNLKEKLLKSLGITETKHVLLYAPTFRNGMKKEDLDIYHLDWDNILKATSYKFGGEWVGFIRLHPNVAKLDKESKFEQENVYDVTNYPDMQELLSISDIVLTDYSSCIYDFGLTARPGFMIIKDMIDYTHQRNIGFGKHGIEIIPFPIALNDDDLLKQIKNFNAIKYREKLHDFYVRFCGLYPGGNASATIVKYINSVIENRK